MSFNETVLRFAAATNWDGPLEGATHTGQVGVRGDGPYIKFSLTLHEGTVQCARFETYTCPAARASCAVVCWAIEGKSRELCATLSASDLTVLLRGLPEGKAHLPEMAVEALRKAVSS
ncbi:MAG: iron-sulfur cluster assembly scaffold protein [Fimbriimonadaceae bacterium]|nr:iron-sulfur cluster assembly scaffold protein [Fimbriimonadaceae bacterium]QYK59146.1 MAG: iron-sulfur cluster assembly scaffold protein [Fimbriimonadaceae bacterium]